MKNQTPQKAKAPTVDAVGALKEALETAPIFTPARNLSNGRLTASALNSGPATRGMQTSKLDGRSIRRRQERARRKAARKGGAA